MVNPTGGKIMKNWLELLEKCSLKQLKSWLDNYVNLNNRLDSNSIQWKINKMQMIMTRSEIAKRNNIVKLSKLLQGE